jgi:hypothetical protein
MVKEQFHGRSLHVNRMADNPVHPMKGVYDTRLPGDLRTAHGSPVERNEVERSV